MKTNEAHAKWNGNLQKGDGTMKLKSVGQEFPFTFSTRFGDEKGPNPDELIAAAHSGCFSMEFSHLLAEEGYEPKSISTTAKVSVVKEDNGFRINKSELETEADVPGIEQEKFKELAEKAKVSCPVSKALSSLEIELKANLINI